MYSLYIVNVEILSKLELDYESKMLELTFAEPCFFKIEAQILTPQKSMLVV